MKIALLALFAALTTGCAFVDVDLRPTDPHEIEVPRNVGRGREVIVNVPFFDKRYEPGRCGMQKNGYNGESATANCEVPPTTFLSVLLHDALVKSGYRVLGAESAPGPTTVIVTGLLGQYFVEPKNQFWYFNLEADIAVRLIVTTPSGLRAERLFYVKGEDVGMASTEGHFQAASDEAVKRILRNMVVAITELLDHYPEVGAPSATLRPVARRPS